MELCPSGTESNFSTVASENSEVISARTVEMGVSSLSAELVANECLDAFLKDRMYVITGRSSKIMHAIGRHLPRKMKLNTVGNMFKQVAGS